jgi:branched-chain amino acid transport system permease protein
VKAMRDPSIRPSAAAGPAGSIAEKAGAGLAWVAATILLATLPLIFRTDSAIAVMCIIGISVVFALSYNVLLGQTGLLSFGHAIFFGLGGFCTIHVMNAVAASHAPVPLVVIPLVGGVGGLFFGVIFGSLASKRGGTIFAMISFGLGELVSSAAPILNRFFGGETGVTTDRSALYAPFGVNFGPQIQVYYLIAGWCLISTAAMYFLTRTPLGQIMRAVRENPERIEFVGCSARQVRFVAFVLASFFAGIAGALAAINFEIMTVSNVGGNQSAMVVLMTYIGGIGYFVGPILGAVLITLMQILLSDITAGWQMYLGILFVVVVMYAPGGLAALFNPQVMVSRGWNSPLRVLLVIPLLLAALGGMLLIELGYQVGLKSSEGPIRVLFGISINSSSWLPWLLAIASVVAGFFGLRQGNLAADNRTAAARRPMELPHG